jgi:hypothetical protein
VTKAYFPYPAASGVPIAVTASATKNDFHFLHNFSFPKHLFVSSAMQNPAWHSPTDIIAQQRTATIPVLLSLFFLPFIFYLSIFLYTSLHILKNNEISTTLR